MSDRLCAPKEAAARLGVSLSLVYKLLHNGELNGYAVGRRLVVYLDSIDSYTARQALPLVRPPKAHAPPTPRTPPLNGPARPFRHLR